MPVKLRHRDFRIVTPALMDKALEPIVAGSNSHQFFIDAEDILAKSDNYIKALKLASHTSLDPYSFNTGFISGLRVAVELLDIDLEFERG